MPFDNCPFQGAIRFTNGILEYILAVHPDGIVRGESGNLFRSRIKISNPPLLIRGEQAVGNSV